MNSIRAAMMGELCNATVLDHLDCCVGDWYELARAPLRLSDPLVIDTMELWRSRLDACLLTDGVIELAATFNNEHGLIRCLLLDALSRLRKTHPPKTWIVSAWSFEQGSDPRVSWSVGRKYFDLNGAHWIDWKGLHNAN